MTQPQDLVSKLAVHEALAGSQIDCNSMQKLTIDEQKHLYDSVAAALREAEQRGFERGIERGRDEAKLVSDLARDGSSPGGEVTPLKEIKNPASEAILSDPHRGRTRW